MPRHSGLAASLSLAVLVALAFVVQLRLPADAKVFYAREEVQELAFPGSTRMEPLEFFLTGKQRASIEKLSREPLETDYVTAYAGYRADELMGYAFIDTHQVRTLPETFLVVIDPKGQVAETYVLAFYEPLEYLPADRWLGQYRGRDLAPELEVGDRIAGITGATLTAEAINGGIRRALAIHAVLISER